MQDPRDVPPPDASEAEKALQPTVPPEEISTGKGVKETIESILIAFILAFVFRAFVVEAFVIPTGSMASTLLGAHMRFTCKECGYQFDVGYSGKETSSDDIDIPSRAVGRSFGMYCPNCRYKVARSEATEPPVRYGDRILVLKYLYIPWISAPRRWDVVVFKTPDKREGVPLFTQNYIKRLIGLPNEKIIIIDGDIYITKASDPQKDDWKIQSKPRYAQDAMWRIIYDNDFRPLHDERPRNDQETLRNARPTQERLEHWTLPWIAQPNSGWDTGDQEHAHVFTFNNTNGGGALRFDPTTVPRYDPTRAPGGYFTDWLAYDATMYQQDGQNFLHSGDYSGISTVSDLKLTFFYERKRGDGPLKARLTKHDHEFVLEMLPDSLKLIHTLPDGSKVEIPALKAINPAELSGPVRVDFANVDYHVTVRINDELAFETSSDKNSKAFFQPDMREMWDRYVTQRKDPYKMPSVSLEAQRQVAAISHISLWRDVYYTSGMDMYRGMPNRPAELGNDEYFVMGDNSAASSDARRWTQSVDVPEESLSAEAGRVPGRFMLGKAFFVYWPAGYRPVDGAPAALVPDFGDMRLIR